MDYILKKEDGIILCNQYGICFRPFCVRLNENEVTKELEIESIYFPDYGFRDTCPPERAALNPFHFQKQDCLDDNLEKITFFFVDWSFLLFGANLLMTFLRNKRFNNREDLLKWGKRQLQALSTYDTRYENTPVCQFLSKELEEKQSYIINWIDYGQTPDIFKNITNLPILDIDSFSPFDRVYY